MFPILLYSCSRFYCIAVPIFTAFLLPDYNRYEWEKEIPVDDARELLRLCDHSPVMKTRFIVPFRGHNFEVDVFHGENEGLIMAELELCSVNEEFAKPEWLGEEVTSDPRYYNSSLAVKPFSRW